MRRVYVYPSPTSGTSAWSPLRLNMPTSDTTISKGLNRENSLISKTIFTDRVNGAIKNEKQKRHKLWSSDKDNDSQDTMCLKCFEFR